MPFQVHILQKAKFASFKKIHHTQKNVKNVHGNVIHIAHLLSSIEIKKL